LALDLFHVHLDVLLGVGNEAGGLEVEVLHLLRQLLNLLLLLR